MSRPFAAFDIDGTLIRWQLYHAIVDELAQEGHIKPDQYNDVKAARMIWKNRTDHNGYSNYEQTLVDTYHAMITTLSRKDYMTAVHSVIDEYKQQTYTYTRDLITSLKQRGYLIFAISGSQQEAIELLAEQYGFDDFGGTEYEYRDGHFTGQSTTMRRDRKPEFLKQLVAKHDATYTGSIAVGDSGSDIPLLQAVEQPIAFNPEDALYKHARSCGWSIVLERKNVIYELREHDATYLLD